ncbi:hypothetical protein [Chitinophaga rhizosphaerae]|uniref:hypothetical protein n=1 Tax=Chitinophaga rhizosphaerae TaxID=1864947 RepID=UPI000F812416|nr:hypothetical protein [Chitinophaga rhizosphaerae]
MAQRVPFYASFKTIGHLNAAGDWLLYLSVFINIANVLIERLPVTDQTTTWKQIVTGLICLLAICCFLLDQLSNYLFFCANMWRRNDLFDNSLNTVLSEVISEGYFSNDEIHPGIYKLGVNSFENTFLTLAVVKEQLRSSVIKLAIVVIVMLFAIIFGPNEWFIVLIQLAIPFVIAQQTIRLLLLKNRLAMILDSFKQTFALPRGQAQDNYIINAMTNYEATMAWASIKLSDKLFDEANSLISGQWIELKKRLNIQ